MSDFNYGFKLGKKLPTTSYNKDEELPDDHGDKCIFYLLKILSLALDG